MSLSEIGKLHYQKCLLYNPTFVLLKSVACFCFFFSNLTGHRCKNLIFVCTSCFALLAGCDRCVDDFFSFSSKLSLGFVWSWLLSQTGLSDSDTVCLKSILFYHFDSVWIEKINGLLDLESHNTASFLHEFHFTFKKTSILDNVIIDTNNG